MKIVRVEGHDWQVESIREDGNKLIVTVKGGQEISTRGDVASTVRNAFTEAPPKRKK